MKLQLTKSNPDVNLVKNVIIEKYKFRVSGFLYENPDHYLIFLTTCSGDLHAKDVVAWATCVQEIFNKDDETPLKASGPHAYHPDDELNPYTCWVVAMEFRYK